MPLASRFSTWVALLKTLDFVSWVGVYRLYGQTLWIDVYQGKIACTKIEVPNGVCGHCAKTLQSVIVPNVHEFKGHIACDAQAQSEIVLPIMIQNQLYGVLDLDSHKLSNFDQVDEHFLFEQMQWVLNVQ